MNSGFRLPPNYTIRPVRTYVDRWAVYRLLILQREAEPDLSQFGRIFLSPYTLLPFGLLAIVLLVIPALWSLNQSAKNLIYILLFFVLFPLGYLLFFQLGFLYNLVLTNGSRRIVALYQGQIIGSASMSFQENYAVLEGLYVAPGHRRQGIGSSLIASILQRVDRPVYLAAPPNVQAFYARFNFVPTNRLRGYTMMRPVTD